MITRRNANLARHGLVDFGDPIFSSLFLGFDEHFERIANLAAGSKLLPNYPPYNVIRDGDNYTIEVALAGIDKEDLEVEVQENTLRISYESSKKEEPEISVHKGIAQRSFKREFSLAEDVEVIAAVLKNGLLEISLERIIPDEKKPKQIKIG
jgi:molecular chaperone IbpA|tara:strand:- start:3721 stop:4176 length:456 start_codon:yes stop_codon:yes gene_type:complete